MTHKKADDLDGRLEAVMDSHRDEPDTTSATSGLQSFASRPSIAEEIGAARSKAASEDLNAWRAREKIAQIIEMRSTASGDFHETLKTAAAQYAYALEEQATINNYITTLRGTR